MQKYTFVVDVVSDSAIDANTVRASLLETVDGIGTIAAVHPAKVDSLKEQGFKVWRARVAGIKEPAKVKAPKAKKVEAEVATATA
jgi:tripartite-type tricarboxylate transporter receptor subunit TctC